jgi:hypothetical protein
VTNGTEWETITTAPMNTPADPKPAMALPIISAVDVGAAPQTRDPSSKIAITVR